MLPKIRHLQGAGYLDAVSPFLFQSIMSDDSLIRGQKKTPREMFLQSPPVPPGTGVSPGSWGTSTPCLTKWLLFDMDLHQHQLPFPVSFDNSIAASLASQLPLGSVVPAAFYSQDLTGEKVKSWPSISKMHLIYLELEVKD